MAVDVELVQTNKFLGLQLDDRLEHLWRQWQLIKLTNNNNDNLLLLFTVYFETEFVEKNEI